VLPGALQLRPVQSERQAQRYGLALVLQNSVAAQVPHSAQFGYGCPVRLLFPQQPLLAPHWLPLQLGLQTQRPPVQDSMPEQVPQVPPQPSLPQVLPAQLGMHWQRLELLLMFCERSLQLYGVAVGRPSRQ
jgi:hypothetical protein